MMRIWIEVEWTGEEAVLGWAPRIQLEEFGLNRLGARPPTADTNNYMPGRMGL